eukprot:1813067-Rhodomonas_salina.1
MSPSQTTCRRRVRTQHQSKNTFKRGACLPPRASHAHSLVFLISVRVSDLLRGCRSTIKAQSIVQPPWACASN